MNGWLRPIPLRIVERGPIYGGFGPHVQDIRQPQPFLGQATLRQSYELGRPVAHLDQGPKCCNSPDGTKCFDHSTGECINTWNSAAPTSNVPDCVQNPRGEWVHPDCWTPPPAPQMEGRTRRLPFFSLGALVNDLPDAQPIPTSNTLGKWQPHGWKFWERKPKSQAPAAAATPASTPEPTPTPEPTSGKKLIACVNGPDLYDIYNPDMSLVARGVLNPAAQYPDAEVEIAQFPPCPVPQATGVGGLCDVPSEYLAPKDPNGPRGKEVLACFEERGVTLFDYVTGAVIGTHLNAACLSLLSSVTRAQEGDPRCAGISAATTTPPSGGTGTTPPDGGAGTTPPSGGAGTAPGSGDQGASGVSPAGGGMPVSNLEPTPAAGGGGFLPVLPQQQSMTSASPPTGAFPGQPFAAMPPAQKPIPTAKAPAPLPPACPLGPVPIAEWAKGCMGS